MKRLILVVVASCLLQQARAENSGAGRDSPASPPSTFAIVDPHNVSYVADHIELGIGEVFYILSKSNGNIFRWSLSSGDYLSSIPLAGTPTYMTYSKQLDRLYVAYSSGKVTKIDVGSGSLIELDFIALPQSTRGLATAGKYLFVCGPGSSWVTHYTYDEFGRLVSQAEWNTCSLEYIWSPACKKMFYFQDGFFPNNIHWEDIDANGVIGKKQKSPYYDGTDFKYPIRVKPDGSVVLFGSGREFNALSLTFMRTLPHSVTDAVWKTNELFTLSDTAGNSVLKHWDSSLVKSRDYHFDGAPLRCFDVSTGFVVVVNNGGNTRFFVQNWDWASLQYYLNCKIIGNGTVAVTNGWHAVGASVTLSASPALGGRFIRWGGAVPEELAYESTIRVAMTQDRNIYALFDSQTNSVTPISGDWPMYGKGPTHSGHYRGKLSSSVITQKWVRSIASANQVAVGGGRAYITQMSSNSDGVLHTVDEKTGTSLWSKAYSGSSIYPPSYDAENIYLQNREKVSYTYRTLIRSVEAATGIENWNSVIGSPRSSYYSPTIADGGVWINGHSGMYCGMYGYDQFTGSQRFFQSLEQDDNWAPAYASGVVYTWMNGYFRAHDPRNGTLQWSLKLGQPISTGEGRTIAIDNGLGYVISDKLYAVDLTDHHVEWSVPLSFQRTPAVANGVIYTISGSKVLACDAFTGSLLHTYSASAQLSYNLVVCDNALFAASSTATYIFDLWAPTARRVIPAGGHLSLANGALFVASGSAVYAYDLTASPIVRKVTIEGFPMRINTADPDYGTYDAVNDTELTLRVDPSAVTNGLSRYTFAGWTGTGCMAGSGSSNVVSFIVTSDATINWNWRVEHWLELHAEHGSIAGTVTGWKPEGYVYDLYPSNAVGYVFSHWVVDGVPATPAVPLSVTMTNQCLVEAVFDSAFIDVTSITRASIVEWNLSRQTGTYLATLELTNPTNSVKTLTEPFWFLLGTNRFARLMYPDGIEATSGSPYVDITAQVKDGLRLTGDGDVEMDPGETVRVSGIEVFSYDRSIPSHSVLAIWADPPCALRFDDSRDTDGDGIPNEWEDQFSVLSRNDPGDAKRDSDGDGMSSLQEYLADTDPLDKHSLLSICSLQSVADGVILKWTGGIRVQQVVEFSSDLRVWHVWHTNRPPTSRTNALFHDAQEGHLFFRVRVMEP